MCDAQCASQNRNVNLLGMTFDAEIEKNVQRTGAMYIDRILTNVIFIEMHKSIQNRFNGENVVQC